MRKRGEGREGEPLDRCNGAGEGGGGLRARTRGRLHRGVNVIYTEAVRYTLLARHDGDATTPCQALYIFWIAI